MILLCLFILFHITEILILKFPCSTDLRYLLPILLELWFAPCLFLSLFICLFNFVVLLSIANTS